MCLVSLGNQPQVQNKLQWALVHSTTTLRCLQAQHKKLSIDDHVASSTKWYRKQLNVYTEVIFKRPQYQYQVACFRPHQRTTQLALKQHIQRVDLASNWAPQKQTLLHGAWAYTVVCWLKSQPVNTVSKSESQCYLLKWQQQSRLNYKTQNPHKRHPWASSSGEHGDCTTGPNRTKVHSARLENVADLPST